MKKKEEMCSDFLILLGINDLGTFPYKVKKKDIKESYLRYVF